MTRAWFMTRVPSVGPVLGASVPRTQIAPSSRCGRNSEPMTPLVSETGRRRQRSQRRDADGDPAAADGPAAAARDSRR